MVTQRFLLTQATIIAVIATVASTIPIILDFTSSSEEQILLDQIKEMESQILLLKTADKMLQEREYEEARELYEEILRANPDNPDAIIGLGNAYLSQQNIR